MFQTRIHPIFRTMLLSGLVLAASMPASAQPERQSPARTQVQPTAPQTVIDSASADEIRRDFYEILERHPPALGRILRLDPSLMQNQDYLGSYPRLAAFLAQHPDVARNPGYYLERYGETQLPYRFGTPEQQAIQVWREVLDFMGAFLVFLAIASALIYLLRYLVEYRRWHRVAKIQTEVHNKILDRFASNEDLLAYIQTPAGRRFLESTPITAEAGPRAVGAPYGRILVSVQAGVVIAVAAIGLIFVSTRAVPEVGNALFAIGILAMMIGVGFVASAAVAYTLSRRMGLIEAPAVTPASHTDTRV